MGKNTIVTKRKNTIVKGREIQFGGGTNIRKWDLMEKGKEDT